MEADHEIHNVSDTALMVAACRAMETERPDGLVRDPFAARLAGERGMAIARALPMLPMMCFGIGKAFPSFPIHLSLVLVFASMIVSVATGLVSGFAPAWTASRLDPVVALRYE